jgi:hypothetical protein
VKRTDTLCPKENKKRNYHTFRNGQSLRARLTESGKASKNKLKNCSSPAVYLKNHKDNLNRSGKLKPAKSGFQKETALFIILKSR